MIIVSGMARGVDSIAHKAAIENKGMTIAVLGSGINLIYPFHQLSVKGFIETGSIAEFIVFFLAVIFILTTIFGRFIF